MLFKQLESFVVVAETLHFRRAAARLGITQPALSQHIAALEKSVGVELLSRSRRHVALTEAGALLLEGAKASLDRLERAVQQARALGAQREQTLVVGQLDYTSHAYLPRSIGLVKERYPDAVVETRDMTPDQAIAAVREGDIDLGFAVRPVDAPDLVVRDVVHGKWVVVVPKSDPLAASTAVQLGALAGRDLIVFARRINPKAYDALLQRCEREGFAARVRHHVATPHHGPQLVLRGVGVFIVGDYVLADLPKGLVVRPLLGFQELTVVAVWRPGARTPLLRTFLEGLPPA